MKHESRTIEPVAHAATTLQFLRDIPQLRGWIEDAETWTVDGGYDIRL